MIYDRSESHIFVLCNHPNIYIYPLVYRLIDLDFRQYKLKYFEYRFDFVNDYNFNRFLSIEYWNITDKNWNSNEID